MSLSCIGQRGADFSDTILRGWIVASLHGRVGCMLSLGLIWLTLGSLAAAAQPSACPKGVNPKASTPLATGDPKTKCSVRESHGMPLPDPSCTPGAINPTITLDVLQGGKFKTPCERDRASSRPEKTTTYQAYGIEKPNHNSGRSQVCELDHLISLELGGADTLDNIWPQCGPDGVALAQRYFKIKDGVENYLAARVRAGDMDLQQAQRGIATDWTQYIPAAQKYWKAHSMRGFGRDE